MGSSIPVLSGVLQEEAVLMSALGHHFRAFVEGGAVLLCKEDVIFFLQAKLAILLSFAVRWCAGQDFPCDNRLWS